MGAQKVSSKGGGFFHLFDWSRKSRKKLFANGIVSPDESEQPRESEQTICAILPCPVKGDDRGPMSNVKGSSEISCASSVTDEESSGMRTAGVVARLMGLDSLPTTSASEPYATPFLEPWLQNDSRWQKRTPTTEFSNQRSNVHNRIAVNSDNFVETKSQKMPSSPIDRFQREILPPRSAKSLPFTHHKLLSPIKNPRFFPSNDPAYIMEEAAKILEPGYQATSKSRVSSEGPPLRPLRFHHPKQSLASSQRMSQLLESSRKTGDSDATKCHKGKSLSKSWNGSESNISGKASLSRKETNTTGAKGKGKSVSLAIQAKVNVQKREGLSIGNRSLVQKEQDGCKPNQPYEDHHIAHKIKTQKKSFAPDASGVLKQNNQKQNCLVSKDKKGSATSVSNQQGKKNNFGEGSSSGRTTSSSEAQANSAVKCRKKGFQTYMQELPLSTTNNISSKKRPVDRDNHSQTNDVVENIIVGEHEKFIQHNVIADEHLKRGEYNKKCSMDVVSFTFTSPISKPVSVSHFPTKVTGKKDLNNDNRPETAGETNFADGRNKKLHSYGVDKIDGNNLSALLDKKLTELLLGLEPSYFNLAENSTLTTLVTSQDSQCMSEASASSSADNENDSSISDSTVTLAADLSCALSHKLQAFGRLAKCSKSGNSGKEHDFQMHSSFCTREASFSSNSSNSSESCDSINEKIIPLETGTESSDSASSSIVGALNEEHADGDDIIDPTKTNKQELEYVAKTLSSAHLTDKNFVCRYSSDTVNSVLFEQLENEIHMYTGRNDEKECRSKRKALFDCVKESLDSKQNHYFNMGYQTWTKGMAVIRWEEFAEEIYGEISRWKNMADWMVDELVDNDMSNHLCKWTEFGNDAFGIGVEIGSKVLGSLIEEMVNELLA